MIKMLRVIKRQYLFLKDFCSQSRFGGGREKTAKLRLKKKGSREIILKIKMF